ncbi:MAG: alpha-glucan family phosphorylase [Ignavibacteriae bacterium]|nr:alpha-glucan family phosphorylase [Ignavibacteriota bacterium]
MKPVATYIVSATLPQRISALKELAYNYWWCWNIDAQELFERIDIELWEEVSHNPVALLNRVPQSQLKSLSEQADFVSFLDTIYEKFRAYMEAQTWYASVAAQPNNYIAYFSLEYGINESFPNYSGGLGVLAGDHLKSTSDLGVPLIGVGLLYQMGYFRQSLTQSGWQKESYFENDFYSMPMVLMKNPQGDALTIELEYPLGKLYAQIWKVQVGRTPLYLLDTNIHQNSAIVEYRDITDQLYGGNTETRIQQEILLGVGGIRALRTIGINPTIIHINEGHAAFATLERTRYLMQDFSMDFATAMELTHAGMIFTTHTPVPAGNEVFNTGLMDKYFSGYWRALGITRDEFLALGNIERSSKETFSMTILALRLSSYRNGVSQLHGDVARKMWQELWKDFPQQEVPISAITNGVHTLTWIAGGMGELYDRYLTPRWRTETDDQSLWKRVDAIPSEELWRVHQRYRERLVLFARKYLQKKLEGKIAPQQLSIVNQYLNPDALTIGFARRFATYKRATLLFSDMQRLKAILTNPQKPVQIILAGKAHPHDTAGKEMIQAIIQNVRLHGLEHHVVFLEDYSMAIARAMVKGSDIWLNTPRRPHEASGTSGMKAGLNGCLHVSVLDGWWDEGYTNDNGFTIGLGEDYPNREDQDAMEALLLYDLLEQVIVPTFYERPKNNTPHDWVERMKASIRTVAGKFSTTRMVRDYAKNFYLPAMERTRILSANNGEQARSLHDWKRRMLAEWVNVKVQNVHLEGIGDAYVGKHIEVYATVDLGELSPNDVLVEGYYGGVDSHGNIDIPHVITLQMKSAANGVFYYQGGYECTAGGVQGCTVRVLPYSPFIAGKADMGVCAWA